jgi:hypothetical protein
MIIPRGTRVVSNQRTAGNISTQATQQAVSNFGAVTDIVDTFLDQRAEANALDVKNKLAEKRNEIINKAKGKQGADAQGITPELYSELESYEKEITSSYGRRTLNKVTPYASGLKNDTKMALVNYESEQEKASRQATFNKGMTIAFDTVRTDAKEWEKAKVHLDESFNAAANSGVFMPEEIEAKKIELEQKFRGEVGQNYYTQDRHDFVKNIDRFGFGKPEKQAWLDKYSRDNMAEERERKSLYSDEKARILGMRDDMKAQSIANSNTSFYFENADKLEKMGYKNEALELREEGGLYSKVIEFNQINKNRPLSEIFEESQKLSVSPDLEGSDKTFKANLLIQKEINTQMKLFKTDPASFVAQKAIGQTSEEIADSRMRLQKEQGISGVSPRILTNEEKTGLKNLWDTGDVGARANIISRANEYGKHSGKVLSELGVNSTLQLAPLLGNERDVKMLVAGVQNKTFKDFGDEGKNEYVARAKNSEFYQMAASIQKDFPMTSIANEKLQEIEKVMLGISSNNIDPAAGPEFFDKNFNILNQDDMKVFMPKTLDPDEVEDLLAERKEKFLNERLQGSSSLTEKLRIKSNIKNSVWVNTSSGVALVDKNTGAAFGETEFNLFDEDPNYKNMANKRKQSTNKVSQR